VGTWPDLCSSQQAPEVFCNHYNYPNTNAEEPSVRARKSRIRTFFSFQATILLNTPGQDFTGGEFLLVENRPRVQARAQVVPLGLGDMVIFAVNQRADRGKHGYRRASVRHGVSDIHTGERHTLGIIFHDAS
jgi:hypothetical protein